MGGGGVPEIHFALPTTVIFLCHMSGSISYTPRKHLPIAGEYQLSDIKELVS
jgi:hypothetical protein